MRVKFTTAQKSQKESVLVACKTGNQISQRILHHTKNYKLRDIFKNSVKKIRKCNFLNGSKETIPLGEYTLR